jgi:hypothetical protein
LINLTSNIEEQKDNELRAYGRTLLEVLNYALSLKYSYFLESYAKKIDSSLYGSNMSVEKRKVLLGLYHVSFTELRQSFNLDTEMGMNSKSEMDEQLAELRTHLGRLHKLQKYTSQQAYGYRDSVIANIFLTVALLQSDLGMADHTTYQAVDLLRYKDTNALVNITVVLIRQLDSRINP